MLDYDTKDLEFEDEPEEDEVLIKNRAADVQVP